MTNKEKQKSLKHTKTKAKLHVKRHQYGSPMKMGGVETKALAVVKAKVVECDVNITSSNLDSLSKFPPLPLFTQSKKRRKKAIISTFLLLLLIVLLEVPSLTTAQRYDEYRDRDRPRRPARRMNEPRDRDRERRGREDLEGLRDPRGDDGM